MPQCLKKKLFDQCVLPIITYGAETLLLTRASANKILVTQRKMGRSIFGMLLRDNIRNEDIGKRTSVTVVVVQIHKLEWKWTGHVARMTHRKWTNRLLEWTSRLGKKAGGDLLHVGRTI